MPGDVTEGIGIVGWIIIVVAFVCLIFIVGIMRTIFSRKKKKG